VVNGSSHLQKREMKKRSKQSIYEIDEEE